MVKVLAYAKVNLVLDLLGKRPDGYHELVTVMQSISLADELSLVKTTKPGIVLKTNKTITDKPQENLIYKAAQLLLKKAGRQKTGLKITLTKNIPVAGGLGGGSADCAAVLHGLNKLLKLNFKLAELENIANQLGSDISFCLQGGTMIAQGRGEKLTPLPFIGKLSGLILKPPFGIATADVYKLVPKNFSKAVQKEKFDIYRDQKININNLVYNISNDLFPYALKIKPELVKYLKILERTGPAAWQMSGSGPCLFAFYTDSKKRDQALAQLPDQEVYPMETINKGFKFQ